MPARRFLITAGHLRSRPAEAVAELLRRKGHEPAGLLVPRLSIKQLRMLVVQQGFSGLTKKLRGAFAGPGPSASGRAPLAEYLEAQQLRCVGLTRWAREHGVPVHRVPSLNSEAAIACVRRARPDAVIYSGGGILRSGFLGAAGRVVNAHAGPLPEIRGMNAAEWAALLGLPARVAIHFIDEGIDTGELIQHVDYDRSGCEDIEALRQSAVVAGVEGLVACIDSGAAFAETEPAEGLATVHRQCFVMAPSLQSVLARRLAGSN